MKTEYVRLCCFLTVFVGAVVYPSNTVAFQQVKRSTGSKNTEVTEILVRFNDKVSRQEKQALSTQLLAEHPITRKLRRFLLP